MRSWTAVLADLDRHLAAVEEALAADTPPALPPWTPPPGALPPPSHTEAARAAALLRRLRDAEERVGAALARCRAEVDATRRERAGVVYAAWAEPVALPVDDGS